MAMKSSILLHLEISAMNLSAQQADRLGLGIVCLTDGRTAH